LNELPREFIDSSSSEGDLYGDGDQSFVKADYPTDPGQRLRDMWSNSGDFYDVVQTSGSEFMQACFLGKAKEVKAMIDATEGDVEARHRLLELRESMLRFSPLMTCICGSKNIDHGDYFRSLMKRAQHFLVAEHLCAAGE
jgi:hypothetical protein